jgi:hypothetical protein
MAYNPLMANKYELTLNQAALHNLLQGIDEFPAPAKILAGLSGGQACQSVPGSEHSIATLLGHMLCWQEWFMGFARRAEPQDPSAEQNFPAVTPQQWPGLVQRFMDTLAEVEALATPENCAREFVKERSLGYALASQASHNAYHLGQIVLLRRILGLWPPADAG